MSKCSLLVQEEIKRIDKELTAGKTFTHDGIHLKEYRKELLNMAKGKDPSEQKRLISLLTEPYKRTVVANLGLVFKAIVDNKEDTFVLKDVEVLNDEGTVRIAATKRSTKEPYTFTLNTNNNLTEESHIVSGGAALARKVFRNHYQGNDILHPKYRKAFKKSVQTVNDIVLGNKEITGDEKLTLPKADSIVADYVHGDPDHMKRLMLYMNDLSGKKESEEHLQYLIGLIDHMHPRFFREMNISIEEDDNTTAGYVNITKNTIRFSASTKIGPQSGAEVVAHELIHSMTAWALRTNVPQVNKLKQQLHYLIKTAVKNTSYTDFLGKPENEATKEEVEYAKQMYKYIFNSDHIDDEFLAHALTNENVIRHFKTIKLKEHKNKTFFDKVKDFFSTLMDVVLGNYTFKDKDNTVYEQVYELAFQLAELNAKTEKEIKSRLWFSNLYESITKLDQVLSVKLQDALHKHFPPDERPKGEKLNGSTVTSLLYLAKAMFKAIYNQKYRNIVGKVFTDIGLKPNNEIRSFIRDFLNSDDVTFAVEQLGMLNNAIDLQRNSEIGVVRLALKEKLKHELTITDEEAITVGLLDTNASYLFNEGKSINDIQKYLTDDVKVQKEIDLAMDNIKRIESRKNFSRWMVKQAEMLGKYMATGESTLTMNFNPYAIAIGAGLLHPEDINTEVSPELENAIEKLATLYAIKYTRKDIKSTAASLIDAEPDFITAVLDMYEVNKKTSKERLFKNNKLHYVLGYTKQLYDPDIKMEYAPIDEKTKKEMEQNGYTLIKEIEVPNSDPIGVYVTKADNKPERVKGALSTNDYSNIGFTLKDYLIKVLDMDPVEAGIIISDLKDQTNTLNKAALKDDTATIPSTNIAPLYNSDGEIVDYRIILDKEYKKVHLKTDSRVSEVLPRSIGSTSEKLLRTKQELRVLEVIKDFTEKVDKKFGLDNDMREYALIGPESSDQYLKSLYHLLPSTIREYADKKGYIAVPYDLLDTMFGYRHLKLAYMPIIKSLPESIKNVISIVEEYWVDLIKVAKSNILLKIPAVLINNIVSNIFYEIMSGTSPTRVLKLYTTHYRNAKTFLENHKEYLGVRARLRMVEYEAVYKNNPAFKKKYEKLKTELKTLEHLLNSNPIKELFDLGLLQTVVEDVDLVELEHSNKIVALADTFKSKMPKLVREGANWLYLSKETEWYKTMEDILQLSDLVARAVRNDILKEKEREMIEGNMPIPYEIRERMEVPVVQGKLTGRVKKDFLRAAKIAREREITYAFINYIRPNGKFEEWLNRLGVIMFTKYVKRVQRIIAKVGSQHPVTSLLGITVADRVFNTDTIIDSSIAFKGELFPLYSPFDNIERVIVPPLLSPDLYRI